MSLKSKILLISVPLPWLCITAFTSVFVTPCTFAVVMIAFGALGKVMMDSMSTSLIEEDKWLLSLPAGYLLASGVIALSVKAGLRADTVFWMLLFFAALSLLRCTMLCSRARLPEFRDVRGLTLISCVVALVYYLPGTLRDAVFLADGSFNWMYVDTQFFHAIASSVKSGTDVPRHPGTGLIPLTYHFGPYAIAGIVSSVVNVSVGDALVRVARPVALLSLVLSSYATGRYLGRQAGHETSGGVLAVAGLFFYGSLGAFITHPMFAALPGSHLMNEISGLIPNSGGIFSHALLGHSQVHGMNALLISVAVLLSKLHEPQLHYFTVDTSLLLPALVMPTSILLGFACLGLFAALLVRLGYKNLKSWAMLCMILITSALSAWVMGYMAPLSEGQMVGFSPAQTAPAKLFACFLWFYVGLGVRVFAFTKLGNPLHDSFSAAIFILLGGLIATGMSIPDYDSRYGLLYAQGILAVLSFAWLSSPVHAAISGDWAEVMDHLRKFMAVIVLSSLLFVFISGCWYFFLSGRPGMNEVALASLFRTAKYSFGLFLMSSAVYVLFGKGRFLQSSMAVSLFLACALGMGAWIHDWSHYSFSRKTDVNVSRGEVAGLKALKSLSDKDALMITNQHRLPNYGDKPRSYVYGGLSERSFLLEGWDYSPMKKNPFFQEILEDNELVFHSPDAEQVRSIVNKYKVKYIVAKPETDLKIASRLPSWLSRLPDTGSLKIYAVRQAS